MYGRHNIFHNYIFLHHTIFGTVLRDYRVWARKPERKTPIRRPRRKWEDDIKIDLQKVVWEILDWINLA